MTSVEAFFLTDSTPLSRAAAVGYISLLPMVWPLVAFSKNQKLPFSVDADAKLTHCAEVDLTHLGEDGGLLAAHVDLGAIGGNQSLGSSADEHSRDCAADGVLAQYGTAIPAG